MVMEIQEAKVMPGYKLTEIGVIPEDWKLKSFRDICRVNQGLQIAIEKRLKNPTQKSKLYITIQYLNDGREAEYIDDYTSSVCCEKDDVLMTRTGNTGFVVSGVDGVFHNNFFKVNYDKNIVDKYFLIYYLRLRKTQDIILVKAGTSTIPDLNHNDFYSIPIPLPAKAEQTAIATALSDIDALITSLDKLIVKKRDIKQATMQQLLTGKTRLPGFNKELECAYKRTEVGLIPLEWNSYKFVQIATVRKKKIDPKRSAQYSFCIELEHIGQGSGQLIGYSTTNEESSLKAQFNIGDILFCRLRAYLRKYWLADRDGVCSTEIWPLISNGDLVIKQYLFQLVQTEQFIEVASAAYGTHMPRTDWNVIKNYEIPLPSLKEQTAIATVLSDMDAEIAALEQKREKTRMLKQGMMQELLTGKIRLV